jgi:DmsE family decaheme c-type cytochrome
MKRWAVVAVLLIAAGVAALAAAPAAGQEPSQEPEVITRDICAVCHSDEAEAFAGGAHGRAMAARDPAILDRACVTCHGPADAHVEDPMTTNIVRNPGPEACKSCHGDIAGRLALATPAHPRNSVACLDCHASGHQPEVEAPLLAGSSRMVCGGCHREQAAAASLPFAHRDGGEPFACTNCHSVHGLERAGRLAILANGGVCIDCHSEKAGPFVFPHPPREVNGCVACHQPHGSTNPRLLTRRLVLNLCLECHTGVPAFHDLSQARFRTCTSCHVAVHGSNRDQRLFDE